MKRLRSARPRGVITREGHSLIRVVVEFTLGRKEDSVLAAGSSPATRTSSTLVHSFSPTIMQTLETLIPLVQPGGQLSVPADDWEALNQLLAERHGGHLHVRETREPGFTLVSDDGKIGLLCYELSVEIPDGVEWDAVTSGEFDARLTETLQRNVCAVRVLEAA